MSGWRKRQVTDMARESWLDVYGLGHDRQSFIKSLEAFAELVRADERKALAEQPAQQEPVAWMYSDDYERMLTNETFCTVFSVQVGNSTRGKSTVALYTTPPQRKEKNT